MRLKYKCTAWLVATGGLYLAEAIPSPFWSFIALAVSFWSFNEVINRGIYWLKLDSTLRILESTKPKG